ncbi:MAG: hypothetical protein HOO91_01590 [Bacteroidales bacterium]|nr:hypothetical protein [Bacteroidales bacterium]
MSINLNFSCDSRNNYNDSNSDIIIGIGELVEQTVDSASFTKINLIGQSNISITKGDTQVIKIKAQQNILDIMTHRVSNGVFIVGFENNHKIGTNKGIFVDIITPSIISDVSISGVGNIKAYKGQQEAFNITMLGTGNVDAFDLIADNCSIVISGTGNCNVCANKKLNVTIAGVGKISYKGHPDISQNISGTGNINNAN